MLLNYDMTIIYTEIDARYDHRIKMLQDEIDRLHGNGNDGNDVNE